MADSPVGEGAGLALPSASAGVAPAAPVQVPFLESAARSFGQGATRAEATIPFLAGGLVSGVASGLRAAHDRLDQVSHAPYPGISPVAGLSHALEQGANWAQGKSDELFHASQQVRQGGEDFYGPKANERFNRVGAIVGQLPVGLATLPLQSAERAQDLSDEGVPVAAAQRATLTDAAFNAATAALPVVAPGGFLARVGSGALIGAATSAAGRQAEKQALGADAPADVRNQPLIGTDDLVGGVLGALMAGRAGVHTEARGGVPERPPVVDGARGSSGEAPTTATLPPAPVETPTALHDAGAIEVHEGEPEHLEATVPADGARDDGAPWAPEFDWNSAKEVGSDAGPDAVPAPDSLHAPGAIEVHEGEPEQHEATLPEPEEAGDGAPPEPSTGETRPDFDWDSAVEVHEGEPEHVEATLPEPQEEPPSIARDRADLQRLRDVSEQERALAAAAAGIEVHEVPGEDLGELTHLVESDPESASRLQAQHPDDLGQFMAAVRERNHANSEDRAGAAGADGARDRAASPAPGDAGPSGQRAGPDGGVAPGAAGAGETVGGVAVDRSHRVPYLAGMDKARQKVLIDPRVGPVELGGESYDPTRALVAHETAEVYGKDENSGGMAGGKSYQGAHQYDGTAAEREVVEGDGQDFDQYQTQIKKQAKRILDEPVGAVHPELDPQPYVDSGETGLLEANGETRGIQNRPLDNDRSGSLDQHYGGYAGHPGAGARVDSKGAINSFAPVASVISDMESRQITPLEPGATHGNATIGESAAIGIAGKAAAGSSDVTAASLMRALRQAVTPESLAAASLIKRGVLDVKMLPTDPSGRGLGGLYRFGTDRVDVYLDHAATPQVAAGYATHEATHFMQGLTLSTYNLGHEFDAFRAQGAVDPNHWSNSLSDIELYEGLLKHPVYKNTPPDPTWPY